MFVGYKHISVCLFLGFLEGDVSCTCIYIRLRAARDGLQARCVNSNQQLSFHLYFSIFLHFLIFIFLFSKIWTSHPALMQKCNILWVNWMHLFVLFNILLIRLNRKKGVCGLLYLQRFTLYCAWPRYTADFKCSMRQKKKKRMRHYNKTCKMYCLLSLLVCFITLVCSRSHEHQQRRV